MPKIDNKPSSEQLYQWLIVERRPTSEVADIIGVKRQTVWAWKKQFDIPVGLQPPCKQVDMEYFYFILGETQKEIGERFGVGQWVISHWMFKWGIPNLPTDDRNEILNPVILSEEQEDIIRGTILGDGHLKPASGHGSGKNSYWIVDHGDRQRMYIQHLSDKLKEYIAREPLRYWRSDNRCKNGGVWTTTVRTRGHKFWTKLRNLWYPEGIKIIPVQEIKKLNGRSLAYLYADDGSRGGMTSNIYTLEFTREENHLLAEVLVDKFNLSPEIKEFDHRNQFYIHFNRQETQGLMSVICPYLFELEDIRKKLIPHPTPH